MSIGGPAKRGIAWSLSSNLVIQAFQFAVGVVLARLLEPEDFGVFAITAIFTGLAGTISNVGLGAALVQRREIGERHRRTMWTANLGASLLIVALLVAVSPFVGDFFENELAGPVLALTSVNFFINALSSVSYSTLLRGMRFRAISIVDAAAMVVHAVVTVSMAANDFGVWSIAWGGIAQAVSRCVALWFAAGWRPVPGWNMGALRDLIAFGATLTVKRLLNYCAANVDYFVIGKRLGPSDLGIYTRAYGLMTLPLTQLSRVVMTVLFPAFSRIQDDNSRIIAGYERVVTATALVSFPFLTGLFLTAPAFIGFVYGEKWLPTVAPLQIMCIAGMMKSVSTFVGSIVDAKGRVMDEIRRQAVYLVLLVVGTTIGSRFGTTGVAWAVVGASAAMLVMMQSLLGRLTGMRWRSYIAAVWEPLAASLLMAVTVVPTLELLRPRLGEHSLALLLAATLVGVVTYVLVVLLVPFPRIAALRAEFATDLRPLLARLGRPKRPPATDAELDRETTCQGSPESSRRARV